MCAVIFVRFYQFLLGLGPTSCYTDHQLTFLCVCVYRVAVEILWRFMKEMQVEPDEELVQLVSMQCVATTGAV